MESGWFDGLVRAEERVVRRAGMTSRVGRDEWYQNVLGVSSNEENCDEKRRGRESCVPPPFTDAASQVTYPLESRLTLAIAVHAC